MEGLVLGIDICNEVSHVSYYDRTKNMPESVPFIGNVTVLENPRRLDDIFAEGDDAGADIDELGSLMGYIVNTACKHCGSTVIEQIFITTAMFEITVLDAMKEACRRAGADLEKISFISHEECLAYHAFNMHRELWINGVVLMDYSKSGLMACRMNLVSVKGKQIIAESDYRYETDERLKAAFAVADGTADLELVQDILLEYAKEIMDGRTVSSVYLTGSGFDTTRLPDTFLRYICNKHRVFAGQNLYVKGACYAAWEACAGESMDVLIACRNRLVATLDMEIMERGSRKIFRVAQAGTNWYCACRSVDFIVDEASGFVLHIQPAGGQDAYDEVIDFSDFPYRSNKMSRIGVSFDFTADDRCNITIKDKGFGEFVKSSGKVIYKTIEL